MRLHPTLEHFWKPSCELLMQKHPDRLRSCRVALLFEPSLKTMPFPRLLPSMLRSSSVSMEVSRA